MPPSSTVRGVLGPAALLGAAMFLSNGLLYVASSVASRALGPSSYSVVAAMLALVAALVVPAYSLQLVVARHVATEIAVGRDPGVIAAYVRRRMVGAVVGGAALTLLVGIVAAPLRDLLGLESVWPILLSASAAVPLFVLTVARGALQAERRFAALGANLVVEGGVRLVVVLLAALTTNSVELIVAAPVIAAVVSAAAGLRAVDARPPVGGSAPAARAAFDWRTPLWFASFALATGIDLLIARAVLEPRDAGAYAAAALLGKVVLFLPVAAGQVLLGEVATRHATGRTTTPPLLSALGATGVACGLVVLVAYEAPALVGAVLVGSGYEAAESLYGPYAIAALAFSLAGVIAQHEIAVGRSGVAVQCAVAVPVTALSLAAADTASQMVGALVIVALAVLTAAALTATAGQVRRGTSTAGSPRSSRASPPGR